MTTHPPVASSAPLSDTSESAEELLARATQFVFGSDAATDPAGDPHTVTVAYHGHDLWAVYRHGAVVTTDGRWLYDRDTALRLGRETATARLR